MIKTIFANIFPFHDWYDYSTAKMIISLRYNNDMKSLKIKLQRNEQLTPDFLDLFSKLIINNTDFFLGEHLQELGSVSYTEFQDYLYKSYNFKHNGLKSPLNKWNKAFTFDFESKSNNLVFLLDLSPYMLIYNYGTKSFPLKNLEEIIIYLLKRLCERAKADLSYDYRITIYLFSIYRKELQVIIMNELLNQGSFELLCDFIMKTIQRSQLPYEKSTRKESLREIFQQMFNTEESNLGIKSIIIISSFHEEEAGPFMLYTPNWYTFGFINTGGHFGSYIIDNKEIQNKLMMGNYFKSKYTFKALFLQNWEMTQHLNQKQPSKKITVQEKHRSILFQHQGKQYQDILDFLLRFQVAFQGIKKNKVVNGGESVISTIKDNPNKMVFKTYKVAADSFVYILRTKYVQGWQPVLLNFTSLVENSKCISLRNIVKLRLHLNNNSFLFYQANRNQNNFIITIYQNTAVGLNNKDISNNDKIELANTIEKMDRINSYNFVNLVNQNFKLKELKANSRSSILFFHNNQYEIMNDLCNNIGEWGKYFKIKRICFRFTPELTALFLEEFLNEISFILGRKINKFIFVKQSQSEKRSQKIDQIQSSNRRVMFTKLNFYGNIIEFQLAFLRFIYSDVLLTLDSLTNKLHNRKFKWGVTDKIPNRLINYFKDHSIIDHSLFHKKWQLKTKSKHYKQLFKIYWEEILKKTSYEQFYLKNNQVSEKNYYKIIEVKAENGNIVEKVTFLKVKESHEKENELFFQIAIPPCLLTIAPYFKEKGQGAKPINISELIGILTAQLKKTQEQIIKLIDTYQLIHYKLLKNTLNSTPKIINQTLEKENSELYDIRQSHFRFLLSMQCKEIINKYYKDTLKETMHILPIPTKFLMTTQLSHIQGDINLAIQDKEYSFFICTPYKFIYLYQKQANLYYKVVSLYYEEYNIKENQSSFLQKILKEITYNISQQIYCKDFRIFLQGNFKGGIAKIINNQQFTHMQESKIQLQALFYYIQKYSTGYVLEPHTTEYKRLKDTVLWFNSKLFMLIEEFFPLLRVNYYFQIRKDKTTSPPFSIDPSISRLDTELFMRATFNHQNTIIDITPQNLPDILMKHFFDIIRKKVFISFKFYLKVKNSAEKNQNSFIFIDYFTTLVNRLITDISYEIQRILIMKKDFVVDQLQFLMHQPKVEVVKLELIKEEYTEDAESLCRFIETSIMQHYMRFKRVKQSPAEFLVISQHQSSIFIEKSMLMRITSGIMLEIVYRPSIFFTQEQSLGRNSMHQYLERLSNFINASRLLKELTETYQLPLEPYELYLNQSANSQNNKIIVVKKKKVTKNPATKYLRKVAAAAETLAPVPNTVNTMTSSKQISLNLIYRNYIPLNQRIPNSQGLQALKQDQIFKLGEIHNLKNTYLFLNFCEKNHIIFHFEEKEDQNLLKEISEENKANVCHKCKKYLLYYVFCGNPLVSKESIEQLIYQPLKEAINRKLFDQVSNYLLTHNSIIQQDEEYFIKGSGGVKKDSKEFRFDLPQSFYKEQLIKYLIQHIQIYHYRIRFKSQTEKEKAKPESEVSTFLESIRIIEPNNIENTKIYSDFAKEMSLSKRSYSQQPSANLSSSSNFEWTRFSDFSFAKNSQTASMLKSGQFSLENQSIYKYEYVAENWLFNSARPKFNLAQRYGKCLYLLKVKIREQLSKSSDRQCLFIDKNNYLFSSMHQELQLAEFKKHLLKKFSTKLIRRDSFLKSCLCFEVTDHVGTIKLAEIEDTFSFIVKSALSQYYLENYFYVEYKNCLSKVYKAQKGPSSTTFLSVKIPQNVEYSSASSTSSKQSPQQKSGQLFQEICMSLLEWKQEVDSVLDQICSVLYFKYKSSNALIKEMSVYFVKFLEEFQSSIKEIYKNESMDTISFLVYLQMSEDKFIFWRVSYKEISSLKDSFTGINLDDIIKIGFILTDYFSEITSVIDSILHKRELPKENGKLDLLKHFKSVREKEDTKDYLFRRTMFAYYEINYQHFLYGSYNINPEIDKEAREHLNAIDCWLHQKHKLYKFIKNVKENNVYDISFKNTQDKKLTGFYEIRYAHLNEKPEAENNKPSLSMYRLLLNLIFNDFPALIFRKDLETQEKESRLGQEHAKQTGRTRYIHHCTQIRELMQILQNSPVNYCLFNSYKGSEKFLFEKLGREYVSILREQYSIK